MAQTHNRIGVTAAVPGRDRPVSDAATAEPPPPGAPAGPGAAFRKLEEQFGALEERLAFICRLWRTKRGGRRVPARADLDPTEFHRLWPITFLLEKDKATAEWYVRFAGAAYYSVYGREITGERVRDLVPAGLAPQVLADLRDCAEGGEPIVINGETNWPDRGNVYRYQRILLPFGTEDGEVTHMLGVAAFYNSSGVTVF